ncbi:MAG: hypothetical protein QM750_12440 [Rubrivivax sp.]
MTTCNSRPASVPATMRALTTLSLLTLLVGCGSGGGDGDGSSATDPPVAGGGGGDTPSPSPAPAPAPATTSRIASVSYDYDNNGSVDAVETHSYDSSGRLTGTQYTYTGDGTPDLHNPFGTAPGSTQYVYDAAGRIAQVTVVQASGKSQFSYSFDGQGRPVSAALTVNTGGQVFTGQRSLTWNASGLLTSATSNFGGQASTDNYFYDSSQRRIQVRALQPGGGDLVTHQYWWNSDSTLQQAYHSADDGGINVYHVIFRANGLQTDTLKTYGASQPAYGVDFTHDASGRLTKAVFDVGNNGSVEAVWTINWQAGACTPIKLPEFDPLVNSVTGYGQSIDGTMSHHCGP